LGLSTFRDAAAVGGVGLALSVGGGSTGPDVRGTMAVSDA
jgi:hypothetical protein